MEKLRVNIMIENDEELLQEMKSMYLKCPQAVKYVKDLGIPDEAVDDNIVKIFDLVSDINYCSNCPGVKKCKKKNPLLCTKLVYVNGEVDRQLVPCKELLKQVIFQKQFVIRDFEEDWMDSNLRSIDRNSGRDEALAKYREFVKDKKNNWIYLTGGKNSGRSYFASALVVDAPQNRKSFVSGTGVTIMRSSSQAHPPESDKATSS